MKEKPLLKSFGMRVKYIRKAAKISQEKLAETTQLHPTYISMIESGKTNPTLEIIVKLAKALKIEVSALLSEISPDSNPEIDAKLAGIISDIKKQKTSDQLKLLEALKILTSK
jgi:transcriptional regulator with XRE-family HTH domain